ncbi:hypothetical protein FJTKL_12651 [Diaporthe vaccinii]|uniref:Uncharacterized protein n=1 Tax=Diaporthe vaccinii TaxID=105482 RepID=A0ABR4ED95_9PEZI
MADLLLPIVHLSSLLRPVRKRPNYRQPRKEWTPSGPPAPLTRLSQPHRLFILTTPSIGANAYHLSRNIPDLLMCLR